MIEKALLFATEAHEGQTRKDDKTPYITHPIGVAHIVMKYGGDEEQYVAALLHDVVEDCDVTNDQIRAVFGDPIADLVEGLTNTSKQDAPDLNRKARKALDNERLKNRCDRTKLIKLADIYYNVSDMGCFDRGFAFLFLNEKEKQAEAVREGSEKLYLKVLDRIAQQRKRLEENG